MQNSPQNTNFDFKCIIGVGIIVIKSFFFLLYFFTFEKIHASDKSSPIVEKGI